MNATIRDVESRPRQLLVIGMTMLVVGVALAAAGASDLGAIVTVLALLLNVYAIHTFGRLGPEGPSSLAHDAPRPRPKKSLKRRGAQGRAESR